MYAVAKGKIPGIYKTWDECKENTSGFSGAIFKKFKTINEAENFIRENNISNNNIIEEIIEKIKTIDLSENNIINSNKNVIYVDGGHNKMTGKVAFASVVDYKSRDLVEKYKYLLEDMELREVSLPVGKRTIAISNFDNVSTQQNNGAELLALIIGLRIALENTKYKIIYSDSQVVVDYWSNGRYSDKLGNEKIKRIEELIKLKRKFEGKIIKISGDINLADLGYHK